MVARQLHLERPDAPVVMLRTAIERPECAWKRTGSLVAHLPPTGLGDDPLSRVGREDLQQPTMSQPAFPIDPRTSASSRSGASGFGVGVTGFLSSPSVPDSSVSVACEQVRQAHERGAIRVAELDDDGARG
jgi:hypothetical protein